MAINDTTQVWLAMEGDLSCLNKNLVEWLKRRSMCCCVDNTKVRPKVADRGFGASAMRYVLALGVLIALCTSADAARVHHFKPRHVVHHSQSVVPRFGFAPTTYDFGPTQYDDIPSYNDPSKFGGGAP
jgi:hypothetical protein